MTIVAAAVGLITFVVLRAVSAGWTEQVTETPDNRVIARHRMGWSRSLPIAYAQAMREMPGIKYAMGGSWGGLVHPRDPRATINGMALEAQPFVDIHHELRAPPGQKEAFVADRQGTFVSVELADEFGWKVGDRISFRNLLFPGDIEFNVSGIFESGRTSFARRSLYFHWEYLNERLPPQSRNRINMISAEVFDPAQGASIARAIDQYFDKRNDPTFSQEDRATMAQLVGRFGAVLNSLDFVSVLILGVVLLILGNTVAMSVRERRKEYATLRALGFQPHHVIAFVLGEAALLGLLGSALCLFVAYPLVDTWLGRFLEETAEFPAVHIPIPVAVSTLVLGALLGSLSAAGPAVGMVKRSIVESLRGVG